MTFIPAGKPRIERLESLIKKVRAFAAAAASATSFAQATSVIWRPGGVTADNVYATWPEVVAAVSAINGYVTIGVDVDLAAAIIPAGAWDLRPPGVSGPVWLVNASKTSSASFVTIANAAVTIHGLSGQQDVQIENRSTSDVISVTAANQVDYYMMGFAALYQSVLSGAAVSFFNMTGGSLNLHMHDAAFISTLDGGSLALRATAGVLQIFIQDAAAVDANMLSIGGATTGSVIVSSVSFPGFSPYGTQPSAPTVPPFQMVVRGTAAILVGTGKTAVIPAFITANSRILVSPSAPANDALTKDYSALAADRVVGNPGSFQITALLAGGAGGAINGADTSTVDYEVVTSS
jgi:hypothetical protein